MNNLSSTAIVNLEGDDIPSNEVLKNEQHSLCADIDPGNCDIYLKFSSRHAIYDFARSLLQEAVYGVGGQKEFYPLISDGKALVVEGTRLEENSSRVFVTYPTEQA